jgi:hypothetical protein
MPSAEYFEREIEPLMMEGIKKCLASGYSVLIAIRTQEVGNTSMHEWGWRSIISEERRQKTFSLLGDLLIGDQKSSQDVSELHEIDLAQDEMRRSVEGPHVAT